MLKTKLIVLKAFTREGNNVVVTYKDGSKDTKALADFVNVAPNSRTSILKSNQQRNLCLFR